MQWEIPMVHGEKKYCLVDKNGQHVQAVHGTVTMSSSTEGEFSIAKFHCLKRILK